MNNQKISKTRLRASWFISGMVILLLLTDSIFKFIQPPEVVEGTLELGFAKHHISLLGLLALISILLYSFPRTSVLGAILLTGYLGGAIATHLQLDNPLFSHVLFPGYIGILAWLGLWLRNEHLRELLPVKNRKSSKK